MLVGVSWSAWVLMAPVLVQLSTVPRFWPVIPPTLVTPVRVAALVQMVITPPSPLRPTSPPTSSWADTVPWALQWRMVP